MSDEFVAYRLEPPHLDLAPAPRRRQWMEETRGRNANRCLPLLIANQAGWVVLNPDRVTVTWQGGKHPGDCTIECEEGWTDRPLSHFGSGIVTWRIPFLFRTPPGWNLLMRGPANLPKDGASSLEGVIETDWAVQPAFHSWKLTRAGHPVTWEKGEPICQVLPQRRGELEAWRPRLADIDSDDALYDEYSAFSLSRTAFVARGDTSWQKHYFQGKSPGEARAPARAHQTKLHLRGFGDPAGDVTTNPRGEVGDDSPQGLSGDRAGREEGGREDPLPDPELRAAR